MKAIAIVLGATLLAGTSFGQSYQVTDIGASLYPNQSYPAAINNDGQVVGYWQANDGPHAFLYQSGTMLDIGYSGYHSRAQGINNAGVAVGYTYPNATPDGETQGFAYNTNSGVTLLGGALVSAYGINDQSQIVGLGDGWARIYSLVDGTMVDLWPSGQAVGINNESQVIGESFVYGTNIDGTIALVSAYPLFWQNNVVSDPNQFITNSWGDAISLETAINNAGNIIGASADYVSHAFILYRGGLAQDLGALIDGYGVGANGLNNSNQVVGWSWKPDNNQHAVIWQNGAVYELNTLITNTDWVLSVADGINDRGQIVGYGYRKGWPSSFLLTPSTSSPVSVAITQPVNGAILRYGSSVNLGASVFSPSGPIQQVQFFQGNSLLAASTANLPFYTATWTMPAAGTYVLTAQATGSSGLTTTSAVVSVIVDVPPTVTLTNPANNALIAPGTDVNLGASAASTNGIAQVQFLAGTNVLGTATNAPYGVVWTNVPAGAYPLSAVAIDSLGLATTSAVVSILVDVAPTVTVTHPANNTLVRYGSNVSLGANAASAFATVATVQLLQGTSVLATWTNAPYTATWTLPPAGMYALTALATDSLGLVTTSAVVSVTVDVAPTVTLTNPVNHAVITPGTDVPLGASAASTNGVAQVQFLAGTNVLGIATNAPYGIVWTNVAAGAYKLTAVAMDSLGLATTSAVVSVLVDVAPSVTVTNPADSTIVRYGANVSLGASAASAFATVAKVQLLRGNSVLATLTNAPYTATWTRPAGGTYALTARATDSLGLVTTSAVVSVIVDVPPTVTNPVNHSVIAPGTDVPLEASAASTNGLAQVQFLAGTNVLGIATNAPYGIVWTNVAAGAYKLSAVAMDSLGLTTTSAVVSVLVDVPSSVAVTNPVNNSIVRYGSNIELGASAASPYATVTKVQLLRGNSVLATLTNAPYTATWTRPAGGTYAVTARATDSLGLVTTSAVVSVIVDVPPTVTLTNPVNHAVITPGTDVPLGASAASTNGLAQVQFLAGTNVLGIATNAPYGILWTNVPVGAYKLSAVALDSLGLTTTSAVVSVLIDSAPGVLITNPLNNSVVGSGTNVSLGASVATIGGPVVKLQFYQGTNVLHTWTNAPYAAVWTKPAVGAYVLTARATDNYGLVGTSAPVSLYVVKRFGSPVIISQPTNQILFQGSNLTLNVGVSPTSIKPAYQWYFDNTPLAGATNASWTIPNAPTNDSGVYDVLVTNSLGGETSSNALVIVFNPPSIVTQPLAQAVIYSSNVTFGVAATGTAPLRYQWYFNDTNSLVGATNAMLVITNVEVANAGNYSVVVANDYYQVRSADASLTVITLPIIDTPPADQTVLQGDRISLNISVGGYGPFTYQWLYNGTNLAPIISTVAGNGAAGDGGDGAAATSANLNNPTGVAVDGYGNLFFADSSNNVIREVNTNGLISTMAGNGTIGYGGDGSAATNASLSNPTGVAVDGYGNVFIADAGNNVIREVNTNGVIATVAGNGTVGYGGDGSAATNASLSNPTGVAVDGYGNVFIADAGNNVLREVDTNGIITTVAGNGGLGYGGDGGAATSANLNYPTGVAVDGYGNLFVMDTGNNVVREVNPGGIITTIAGNGGAGYGGDNGLAVSASLNNPAGIAVDAYGDLFIADQGNNVVREVNTNGIITTVAGNGSSGYTGDGGAAILARLNGPAGVSVDAFGNLFLADSSNNVIRAISATSFSGQPGCSLSLFNVREGNAGNYSVLVCNQFGCVTTTQSVLTVLGPPSIVIQPVNWLLAPGSNVTFSVTAQGSPLNYQWYFNDTHLLAGATNSSLRLANVQTNNVGNYSVAISNQFGSVTSLDAILAFQPSIQHTLAIGGERLMSLNTNGNVLSWGGNQYGELGDFTYLDSPNPVCAVGLTNVTAVAAGLNHALAIDSTGVLWAWGWNQSGQLGNGGENSTNEPGPILGMTNPVIAMAGGDLTSVAVTSDGTAWDWGYISIDPCGPITVLPPTPVAGLTNALAVAVGAQHFLALTSDGFVWAWGLAYYGQFGDGSFFGASLTPVQVSGLSNIVAICSGDHHCLALDAHCQVWAWGLNNQGQLGDNAAESESALPVLVFSNAVAIAAGASHSLALDQLGRLWTWGSDGAGQLGDAGSASVLVPTLITSVTNLVEIAAGAAASMALDGNGSVWQWGSSDGNFQEVWNWNDLDDYPQLAPGYVDYYQGQLPTLQLAGGSAQIVPVNQEFPLVLQVTKSDGSILANAPVSLECLGANASGGSFYVLTNSGGTQLSGLRTTTDANGNVSVIGYLNSPSENFAGEIRMLAASNGRVTECDFIGVTASLLLQYFRATNVDLNADSDGDGVSNLQELLNGTDPTDYYNGTLPNLQMVSGSPQTNSIGLYSSLPLAVLVTDANNHILTNAPIVFTAQNSGTVFFSATNNGVLTNVLNVRSDTQGMVYAWLYLTGSAAAQNEVVASAWSGPNTQAVLAEDDARCPMPDIDLVVTNDGAVCRVALHTTVDDIVSAVNHVTYVNNECFQVNDNLSDALLAVSLNLGNSLPFGISVAKLPPPVISPAGGFINTATGVTISLGLENLTNLVSGLYRTELARCGGSDEIQTVVAYAQGLRDQGISDEDIRTNLINGAYFRNSAEYIGEFGAPGDVYLENTNYVIQYSLDAGASWSDYTGSLPISNSVTLLARVQKAGSADDRTKYACLASDPSTASFNYLPASWLIQYFGADYQDNPDAAPTADPDHDGLSNWQEYLAGTNPTNPASAGNGLGDGAAAAADGNFNQRLGYWRFNTTAWLGEEGQVPLGFTNLISVPDWSVSALQVDTNLPAYLAYSMTQTNGTANLLPQFGSVRIWLKPDWNNRPTNGGTGPGSLARLIEIGSQDAADGWWALLLSADGTTLDFVTQTNGIGMTNLSATINWTANDWHQLVLTYSATNSTLYWDGQLTATGAGVTLYPDATIQTNGFSIGSDHQGNNQAGAQFDELETFNYSLTASAIADDYNLLFPGGNGPVDYIGYLEGLNPLVNGATVPDTDGIVNLQIYTPLRCILRN
jgi:probable HAF family extracellular repeat protein